MSKMQKSYPFRKIDAFVMNVLCVCQRGKGNCQGKILTMKLCALGKDVNMSTVEKVREIGFVVGVST